MSDIRIVICQRGWVFVGFFERQGNHVVLTNGATIRRWGTTGDHRGLGSLAANGPSEETHLEPMRRFEALELTTIGNHQCDSTSWEKVLHDLVMP